MAESDDQPESNQPELITTAQTQYFFSNYTSLTAAPEEFILRFCVRDANNPLKATESARVYLSLGHAKRLIIAMARSLKGYEEMFGDIPTDPVQHITPEGRKKLGIPESTMEPSKDDT